MDIFMLIGLIGGLALFLYGMTTMSQGLENLAGSKLEIILRNMTSNPAKGFVLGLGVTAIIQSSSAVTVMLVGLVNSGIMELTNTVGVIMGSNVGTTVTAWILSLVGIKGESFFIRILQPETFSPILAMVGVILMMATKKQKKKDLGMILIGFALLMYGMNFMSSSVAPFAKSPKFTSIITAFENPFLGVLTGLLFTAVIQSSSASVGVLQALSLTGQITYGAAIPIIMGQNIGTCVTALISSIGVSKNAKRVSVLHIAFNLIGTAIFISIYSVAYFFLDAAFISRAIGPVEIAIAHSIFNICTSLILLPFNKQFVKIAKKMIKNDIETEDILIDERLLATPSVALEECNSNTLKMSEMAAESSISAINMMFNYNEESAKKVIELENKIDWYEDKLDAFLIELSIRITAEKERTRVAELLHVIGDFERISDHAINLCETAQEIKEKKCVFSKEAYAELNIAMNAVKEVINTAFGAFAEGNIEKAYRVEPLEEVIDGLISTIKMNHVGRLQSGVCTMEHGFVMNDLLTNLERTSDHCSNIALGMIESTSTKFEAHEYINKLKAKDDPKFRAYFEEYNQKYKISVA